MTRKTTGLLCGIAMFAWAAAACAAEPEAKPIEVSSAQTAQPQPASATQITSDVELASLSGGRESVISLTDQDLTAVNTGNTISAASVGSGAISLSGGALSGFNGVGNFVMNTGHNNNLQSSMSVTVIMAPN
jgi:hypothetical protein